MEQLKSINALSKSQVTEDDLRKMHWYVLFTEIGRESAVRDEWVKIKNKKTINSLIESIEVIWTPVLEEEIDDRVIITPYLYSYYFVGMSKPMSIVQYTELKDMNGVIKVVNSCNNKVVCDIKFDEMTSMFNLPGSPRKVKCAFSPGSFVRIVSGVLQNCSGVIKEIRGKRAFIEAGILKNFSTDLEVNLNCLELAGK